jgi:PAS domain S-box-containing protein
MSDEEHPFRPIDRSQHQLLIVDDDPISRYATARLLRSAGFRTAEAATGAEGLAAAAAGDFSAMIVDVHLPDLDGFELCRVLRSRGQTHRMPVLHLSAAYVTDEDKVRGLDAGADAYLTHPVEPAVLVATVQALVRTRVAEEAMRRSESKFRAIYEQAPSGLALIDGEGRLRDANSQMLRLLGRSLAEVVGRRLDEFQRSAAGDDQRDEVAIDRPDGRTVHLSVSISAQIEPGVSLIVATDVSQRAALETQRQQLLERERDARSEAERVSRLKDTFIAVLSHELRSPLNAMVGWTHVLQQRGGSEETMKALAAIERNGRLQARMISDLLDMSRLNLGKLPLSLDRVDPADVIAAAVSAVQPDLDARQIDLRLAVEPVGTLRADSSRLQQVMWNLLSNAVKFSPPGGQVTVGVRAEGADIVMFVSDQGQGIAPAFLAHVFDRFMQSDVGRNRQHGGLGLGLSIVKQLVEAHGGQVQVHSAGLGQGALFEVRLPREGEATRAEPPGSAADAANDAPDSLLSPLNEGDTLEAPLAGLRLLVVDDDADASGMLQIILRDRGAAVRVAGSSAQALNALQEEAFDVLISDIGMPGKDGYDLVRELRALELETGRHLRAIALTSFTRGQDEAHARAAGFDAHCPKPLRPLNLVGLVARLAGR